MKIKVVQEIEVPESCVDCKQNHHASSITDFRYHPPLCLAFNTLINENTKPNRYCIAARFEASIGFVGFDPEDTEAPASKE